MYWIDDDDDDDDDGDGDGDDEDEELTYFKTMLKSVADQWLSNDLSEI